ncbi:uncharacterized protein L969DRAFT_93090 [Mixia osmundae IAM 14324]|uniref:Branched-chain amino acid aminotransferase n=1 Tax=Mixia osmundae (strain CBS 9802 / IAM 14324 / JCM 22182 / KY 12970) TaxID=764103 RepID=G7E649_MIXOS|nr:uncharacterized protein L969DRAFT_93090 [Mixia osmundae IAM 14324]KEI40537.1 hypothetical protein L969DRAFT_93090 [Mixia osmundae IAM 14324]GAA98309.1 hypothetical protein E5Q_04993 [Mixia osmundae IAM 14324]
MGSINGHAAHGKAVQPKDLDWPKLKFGLTPTNGHVRYTYSQGRWSKGVWVEEPFINLHVGSAALNYGQSAFEGLKAFRAPDGSVRVFRPQENSARLNHSAEFLDVSHVPEDLFLEAVERCVAGNLEFVPPHAPSAGMGALYLRPILFASGEELMLSTPDELTFLVFATPVGSYYGPSAEVPAVDALVLDNFDRTAPRGTGSAKLAGNYAPVYRHMREARLAGYPITLHLDSATRTLVDEFSTSNALFISYPPISSPDTAPTDVTLHVPQSSSILRSVTTKSIVQLAQSFGWTVDARPIAFQEVIDGAFTECAAAGTAAVVTIVRSISYKAGDATMKVTIGAGKAGPCWLRVLAELTALQCQTSPDPYSWLWPSQGIQPSSP